LYFISFGPSALRPGALSIKAAVPTITTTLELGGLTWSLDNGSRRSGNEALGKVHTGGSVPWGSQARKKSRAQLPRAFQQPSQKPAENLCWGGEAGGKRYPISEGDGLQVYKKDRLKCKDKNSGPASRE
jgi:hypothetical protein